MSKFKRKARILLVEDDLADVELTIETLNDSKIQIDLDVVNNGVEAMAYLNQQGIYQNVNRPDLILLDLNMPKKDGREVLKEIRADKNLKTLPVVILTTSSSEEDIMKSYDVGANCYISKPVGLEQFNKVVQAIEEFWFTIVKLPSEAGS